MACFPQRPLAILPPFPQAAPCCHVPRRRPPRPQGNGRSASLGLCKATAKGESAPPKAVSMHSLGCPKNTVDGEVMLGALQKSGFDITDDHESSDAIIVNTCAFVSDAKSESLEAILDAASLCKDNPDKRLIVTGCMAQRYANDLTIELPEVDAFVGFERYGDLPQQIEQLVNRQEGGNTGGPRVLVGSASPPFRSEVDRVRIMPSHSAYLRVAEGCDHKCTFCAIPGFRGKFRSKGFSAIVEEATSLVAAGAVELNLIAEDTNQWGHDQKGGPRLAELLRELSKIEGLRWLRLLYCYPSYFTESLITEIAENEKVCKYIDMPLQHMNNLVLLAMNRPPKVHTEKLLLKLRERIPGVAIRTTFISGFPGETEEQHQELVDFCKSFRFARMGAFAYSEEDGTPAAELPAQVDEDTRLTRRDELVALQQRVGQTWARGMLGKTIDVLVDGMDEDGNYYGRSEFDAPLIDSQVILTPSDRADCPALEVGQMRSVKVTDHITFDLVGHPVF
eukprot:jgi/Ulvmu1/5117/UM021_0134.1